MNIKLLIISIVAVLIVAISLVAILLYKNPAETSGDRATTPLVESTITETGVNATETRPAFRIIPISPTQTTIVNVCDIHAIKISAVLKSKVEFIEEEYEDYVVQREVITITGYIRIERIIQDQNVLISIKKIVIDNPSELYRKGFDQLADQLFIHFEEPELLSTYYYRAIHIQIDINPELYENYLKPGTKHTITVTYLYNGVECTETLEIYMLTG